MGSDGAERENSLYIICVQESNQAEWPTNEIRCKTITFIVVGFRIYTQKKTMKKKKEITIDSRTKANVINTASEKKTKNNTKNGLSNM